MGGLEQRFAQLGFGWDAQGLGHANPYPMTYPVMAVLALLAPLLGSRATLIVLLSAIAFALAYAGTRVARTFGGGTWCASVVTAFLVLEPYTYARLVAGHLTQTLAYAGLVLLGTELLARKPDLRRLAFALVLCDLQTQFALIAFVLTALRARELVARRALAIGLAVFAPVALGIALDARSLLDWPFTVAWEVQQSVPPLAGALLGGYFTGYLGAFMGTGAVGVGLFALLAVGGVWVGGRRAFGPAATALLAILLAAGTTGPFAAPFRWAIVNAPVIGVYRELYDLIALAAAGYALLAGMALARVPRALPVATAGVLALLGVWVTAPPDRWWVAAEALPPTPLAIAAAPRFALVPPFQPETLRGAGSGADPLILGTSPNNTALNDLLSDFPADAALSRYAHSGDTAGLRRLGVSAVACRPGLAPASGAIDFYGPAANAALGCDPAVRALAASPLVALETGPGRCGVCAEAGAGNVLVGEGTASGWARRLGPQRVEVDPAAGWVDARLTFAEHPELAQPLGGAYTTRAGAVLPLSAAPSVLVDITAGELRTTAGALVSGPTSGYRWTALPPQTTAVVCEGGCLVAAVGDPAGAPNEAPAVAARPLAAHFLTPWLLVVDLPATASGIVRVLERDDPSWLALRLPSLTPLPHQRLDGVFAAWRVGATPLASRLLIVNVTAALQVLAGVLGVAFAAFALLRWREDARTS